MSTQHATFDDLLTGIQNNLGISDEVTNQLTALQQRGALGISTTIAVPITNGRGSYTTEKKATFGVTINGIATITAPPNGTWDVTVVDLVAGKLVFHASGVAANQPIKFSYRTGFYTQLQASAVWSEGGNTTLLVQIEA